MQPYLFAYLGYFQLVAAVDRFVFYDDVAFIRNGWINRNRWLLGGEIRYFTIPLRDASSFRQIREVQVAQAGPWRRKLLASLRQQYGRAEHYEAVSQIVERVIATGESGIGALAKASVRACAQYLGLPAEFVDSSAGYGNAHLRGPARVLDICRREGATEYVNLPAGRALYDAQDFQRQGVALRILEPVPLRYRQGVEPFVADLSIIDVLMHNSARSVRRALGCAP